MEEVINSTVDGINAPFTQQQIQDSTINKAVDFINASSVDLTVISFACIILNKVKDILHGFCQTESQRRSHTTRENK